MGEKSVEKEEEARPEYDGKPPCIAHTGACDCSNCVDDEDSA